MARLTWDGTGERFYETGVSHGVLFVKGSDGAYGNGVAWNGLTAVNESPEGAEANPLYADDIKYLNLMSNEEFNFSIEAYTYPDEFGPCNGEVSLVDGLVFGQQKRSEFGFSYQTRVGNDVDGDAKGYKIHLVYNCLASPTEKAYATVNDTPEAITFSWDVTTTPVDVSSETGMSSIKKPIAHIVIDSTKVDATKLTAFLNTLYGTENGNATLPTPSAVYDAFKTT